MKKIILFSVISMIAGSLSFAQVSINSDNSVPHPSAGLDVKFTNKGFLPPRLNTAQRNAIASPATGLVIYNTEANRLEYYGGVSLGWLPNGGSASPGLAIPDYSCSGVSSDIILSGFPSSMPTTNIKVTINITHPNLFDLNICLVASNGQIINLAYQNCANGQNYYNTVFTDLAQNYLPAPGSGVSTSGNTGYFKPFGGSGYCDIYINVSTFSAIGGGTINPNGTWTLKVQDVEGPNAGTLNQWSIDFFGTSYGTPNFVPIWTSSGVLSGTSSIFDNGNVGIGTTSPSSSAALDVSSTSRGFLPPRMTAVQRDAIISPATGLIVLCTDNSQYYYNQGTPAAANWVVLNSQWQNNGANISYIAGNVGIGTTSPSPSAALEVSSTNKGFLPPRMTTVQRDQISSPATGLTIFNTTKNGNETYNGSYWVGNTHYIGESYGGGIVFYVYDNGQHGLIAATADQSTGIQWNNGNNTTTNAVRDQVNAGRFNTERIIINQGAGSYAAQICANYQGGGYGDWYLPSKYELYLLCVQKSVVGGFESWGYWSSNESSLIFAVIQAFNNNCATWYGCNKGVTDGKVRAVRAF